MNKENIKTKYDANLPILESIKEKLLLRIKEAIELDDRKPRVDFVSGRVKTIDSFVKKASKVDNAGDLKYNSPFKEIQDQIGCRVIVFYLNDVEVVLDILRIEFQTNEDLKKELKENEFGYEAHHLVCNIPRDLRCDTLGLDFFEIQIATIFQHAWSETTHDILYKRPQGNKLSKDEKRMIAFMAAQAWGADKLIADFIEDLNMD